MTKPLRLRSLLFVPGDRPDRMEKALGAGADALILDLEDAVAASRTQLARGMVVEYLKSRPDRARQKLWVRINPLDTPASMLDLAAVVAGAPDGILLPKVNGPADITRLGHCLDALEAREGLAPGAIRTMPVATETPQSLFALGGYAGCSERLHGLTWGAEDIAAALGASANRRPTGEYWTPAFAAEHPGRDWILSRILWLCGEEPGRNRLGAVDSMRRFIYIHGTGDDQPMGVPLSHGCVRMHNRDIIELFDLVAVGTWVEIRE